MKAVIVWFMCFRFMFASLHILRLNVWDFLYEKYQLMSQNSNHSNEQALHADDVGYNWRCTVSGLIYIMCCEQRKATPTIKKVIDNFGTYSVM
jgi:hypothetical protein